MKAVISILLSTLILLSSSGIAYAKHYCGSFEMLSKITLGEASLSCGMVMETPVCGSEKEEKHSCCSNKYLKVITDDHFNKADFDFNFQGEWVFVPSEIFEFPEVQIVKQKTTIQNFYRPPPLEQDIQVLYETFLI